jgi:hypothetical protein
MGASCSARALASSDLVIDAGHRWDDHIAV